MSTKGHVIKCKAAIAWEHGKPLVIEDVEVAPPQAHEVRVKIVATGVCHTDWEYLHGRGKGMKFRKFPLVLGHEASGEVESVGAGVTKFSPGDKVIPLFLPQCGECERCKSTKTNQCRKNWANTQMGVLADGTSRISYQGQQVYQFIGVGSFSQYTVVPDTSLAKIRSDAPLDKVCLLGCGVSTGYGAALNTGKVEENSTCAVFGLGAVGLAAVMGCHAAGAKRIIGVDINPDKFAKAVAFGATDCVNPKDHCKPIQEVLMEMTGGGVDYALECVGQPAVMSSAFESTSDACGTCVIAGWTETEGLTLQIEKLLLGRTLKGTYFGGWKSAHDVPKLVDAYMNQKLKLDEFITHTLPLDRVNSAFDFISRGESIRTVIGLWSRSEGPTEFRAPVAPVDDVNEFSTTGECEGSK
ncbi:alcohol dehydrogenase class-3-like [Solea senegalensis]|uniref:Alcohol dehydrogenase 6 n=1 Tax=Solea senegalensis TaxID=28829 RepID=A0AAV6SJY9_SOLSE|nr:alcohol dehydrogenase class-3-like [Solea senegalensis]KAG7517399.1 alcohol dehydrogenase class-3-like [Solea senegalensis]